MRGKLRIYNVEFGDAFLLYGEDEHLLVDLGSSQSTFDFVPVRDSIRQEVMDGHLSLLLTHFHKDRWSGLHNQEPGHELPGLKTVYLPDIFRMYTPEGLNPVVKSLLGEFLKAVVLKNPLQFTLAELLRDVLPRVPKEQIRLLTRGDVFSVGEKNYEVLWPDIREVVTNGRRDRKLVWFLNRLEDVLAESGVDYRLGDTLYALSDALLREFAVSQGIAAVDYEGQNQSSYETIYLRAQRLGEILAERLCHGERKLLVQARYYAEALRKDWNQISLVFHEVGVRGVLMTGDVPAPTMKALVHGEYGEPKLKECYAVINVPHHGTESHFCTLLPYSKFLCISNGEGAVDPCISEQYEYVYGCRGKGTEIRCTNPRCEFARRYDCPYFSVEPVSAFYDIIW